MAESIKGLYLRLGLNFDELNQGFVQAEKSLKENMTRLNRENTLVDLKLKVDLASLNSAKDAAKSLELQEQALTRKIENQRTKVQLATEAWKQATQRTGAHSKQATNTAIAVEREQLALVQLEQELKKVAEQQKALPRADNSLVTGYNKLKSNVSNVYSNSIGTLAAKYNELSASSESADSAITKSLELIGDIPHPVGRAVAAIVLLPLVFKGVENSIISAATAAAKTGDAVYVMSRGFQMSVADTGKFTTNCKIAGVEVNDLASTVKRLQQQVLKAGESGNVTTRMLQRYGVSVYDASGKLKNLNDMTAALSKGLKAAQAEGNGAAFTLSVFRNASGDAITAIEDWADVNAQATTIVKNGLANPVLAHQVQGNLNAMNVQAAQLNASFASVLLPAANEIIPRVTARMGELVKFLAENKEEVKAFGKAVGQFFSTIEDDADIVFSAIGKVVRGLKDLRKSQDQKDLERSFSFNLNPNLAMYNQTLAYYNPMFKGLSEVQAKTEKATAEIRNKISLPPASVADISSIAGERASDTFEEQRKAAKEALKSQQKYSDELYRITHNEYENKIFEVRKWNQELLNDENTTAEQRELIAQLYAEKVKQIEETRANKIAEIVDQEERKYRTALENEILDANKAKDEWIKLGMDRAQAEELAQKRINKAQEEAAKKAQNYIREATDIEFALTHSAFEKQLHDIARWKEEQMEKADTAEEVAAIIRGAAAKEAEAYEQEVERIKGATQSLEDEIFAMENSQFEVDKRRAMQRAQQALDEGVDAETVQRYLQDKMAELDRKASKGGDYTKSPSGGNGRPKYIDLDKPQKPTIGLFADTDKIMNRLKNPTSQVKDVQSLLAQETQSEIEVIRGTTSALNDFRSNLQSAEKFTPQVITQNPLSVEGLKSALETTLARQVQSQPAPVTVSPTININLEGNVIADQQFIDETAEKIKDEVFNGVASAAESATKNNYSYAN